MIDMNTGAFKQHLDFFVTELQDNKINQKAELFTSSQGIPITSINDCLDAYSKYCENIDKVYLSTMNYLQQAYHNIQSCEKDNSI
ncbi:MAG: hypothetical protein J6U23_12185 [Clostridiales bacterium]|nr:hypothetical protein [Clostridiales bacterium]